MGIKRSKLVQLFGPRSGSKLRQKPGCLINLGEDSRADSI
ncbi:hypothetical protein SYN63AY4M2_07465 [Synechococcus sp. 63AY4M2]|nr:hypothetical protein CYA_2835 [Synechococcus sp. JA-3-3Ab]PIK87440.1 hypothetical protein SYN63AY4M2_07465 [Synechococcus sp. 63AY4M2]PIK89820.1 hypothetical protein SYN65AY6A5_11175 [Synechococcus sp. 65AY6A5]PIK93152.1 hypothetical protein SYN65AY6LI_04955 [Synechococcus sp. 65AY6Li]PIK96455.1 hypothetical protein SYN60AY4M2_08060 [Synechococcus sp. 60AY4M2]PIK99054.1 hypothetical protein SYN63AY4M1_05465 [Synechococcus sp. 63AY4M1]PIL02500.1 hypothetical protein SYN65AY640_08595 [Synech